jgi:hypothetical protein
MKILIVLSMLLFMVVPSFGRSRRKSSISSQRHLTSSRITRTRTRSTKCSGCARDKRGRIPRSKASKDAFKRVNPCPSTGRTSGACPGYVIDHKQALKHGGSDTPDNMQWQTKEAAKAKDKVE